jgi:hypothetical protein
MPAKKTTDAGLEEALDELLALPPEQFTAARNAAARALQKAGNREAADEVKAIPRPPLSLWALNVLAREQPEPIATFLAAAAELRKAYASGGDIRAATAPERVAEARVVAAGVKLIRASGKNASDSVTERMRETLRSAAADGAVASELQAGRLVREPEAPSLDALLGSLPQSSERAHANAPERDRVAERDALREQIAGAKADAARAQSEARTAARTADEAQREWQRAQKAAAHAQEQSDAAAELLRDLRQRLEDLPSSR